MNFKTVLPEYGRYTEEAGASSNNSGFCLVGDMINVSRTASQIRLWHLNLPVTVVFDATASEPLTVNYHVKCAILGYYAASSVNFSPTLKMGATGCPETSVINYHYSIRNNPEKRSSNTLRGGSLQSQWTITYTTDE